MFADLRKKLYFARSELLVDKGLSDGSIVPFSNDFYEQMNHTYASGIPVALEIKYLKPRPGEFGQCYDRSLKMFFCFDDALLVRGNRKDLEFMHGKEDSCHRWIEIGDYVYDPTSLYRFEKKLYYKIFGVSDVKKCTMEEYVKIDGNKIYENVKNTTLDDFRPGGSKRHELLFIIPLLIANSKFYGEEYEKALNDYLLSIQYDAEQIFNQLEKEARQLFIS